VDADSSGTDLSDPGTTARKAAAAPKAKPGRRATDRRKSKSAAQPDPPAEEGGFTVRPADVRRMLVDHPAMIEDGLEVYSEDGEVVGASFSTAVGVIDLLARDDSGGWVVVSVPAPEAGKNIVSDLLQRMGWVRRHLGKSGEEVRGVVLLDSLPDDLGYAAAAVSDSVEFKLYQMALTLESVIV
jgi:hypothetical protein